MLVYANPFRAWLIRTRRPALPKRDLALIERLEYLRIRRRKLRVYLNDPDGRYSGLLILYALYVQQTLQSPNAGLVYVAPRKLPVRKARYGSRLRTASPIVEGPAADLRFAASVTWRSAAGLREQPLAAGALLLIGAHKYRPRHYLWASYLTDVRRALLPKLPNRPDAFAIITGDARPRRRNAFAYHYRLAKARAEDLWYALDPETDPIPVQTVPGMTRRVPRITPEAAPAQPELTPNVMRRVRRISEAKPSPPARP